MESQSGRSRAADGKPDFSGMWGWETGPPCGARCGDIQISRELIHIAATLQRSLRAARSAAHWTDDHYQRIYRHADSGQVAVAVKSKVVACSQVLLRSHIS